MGMGADEDGPDPGICILLLISLAFLLLFDRKVWAAVQLRKGPNVVGPFGLLQSFADFFKFVFKEIVIPAGANKVVFILAPLLTFVLALVGLGGDAVGPGWVIADINVGILYLFAISSLGVYGIIMGGWASNSKYPFLGALRSAAQMVSYEVSIGFVIITVLLLRRLAEPDDHRRQPGRRHLDVARLPPVQLRGEFPNNILVGV
jgi:NADH-quinone oxidoreductase subunit H